LATSESTRARRFALPDLADERTEESIEAFLEGPKVRRGRRSGPKITAARPDPTARALATTSTPRQAVDLRSIPGRLEWNAALERESLRAARYERPAAVAIVELKPLRAGWSIDPWIRTVAGPIARALRQDSRATDLVARVADARFQILLPETTETGAEHLAERVTLACKAVIERSGVPATVRVSVAGTGMDDTLQDALAIALRSIEAA
jgi:GGDEF domain-containing protein